ncbi:hypothetical protein EC991_009613 [Linnemannia zychae]|nr:hypothetical protein EC991_009613 [Linnemannia zychae]
MASPRLYTPYGYSKLPIPWNKPRICSTLQTLPFDLYTRHAQLPSAQHYIHSSFPPPPPSHHLPSSDQLNPVASPSPKKPKAKRSHSDDRDENIPHHDSVPETLPYHDPTLHDPQTSNGRIKARTTEPAPTPNQYTIATAFKSIAASPATGARSLDTSYSTASTAVGNSGAGMQYYTLQDGNFYNTGGFNSPTSDKSGNTVSRA